MANDDWKRTERPLPEYLAEVRETSDVRRGTPLPLGTRAMMDGDAYPKARLKSVER